MKLAIVMLTTLMLWTTSCSSSAKPKPRMPLAMKTTVSQEVVQYTALGTREYENHRFAEAKAHFEQALAGAPTSAEAHYNLGLALFALGESDQAREHFIEAANLAPGDKVIWDSPALRPYGSPDSNIPKQVKDPYSNQRPALGGMRR